MSSSGRNSLGNLSQCMMDSDPDALARARRRRYRAILISVILETLLLAAMLLWPLATPGVLPHRYILTPIPPYGGHRGTNSQRHSHKSLHPPRVITDRFPRLQFPTARASNRVREYATDAAPDLPLSDDIPGADFGPSTDQGVPFGFPSDHPGPAINRLRTSAVKPPIQRMSEGVMAGALIYRVEPKYPQIAIIMGLTGVVRLRAIIATDGTIQNLEVVSGNPILAHAAEDAVSHWRYRPTLLSGTPVEVETLITVNFVLSR